MSDIIVIGGGVAGVSVAACLAPHARVTLLENEKSLAYHASGRSAAMFIRDYGNASVKALNAASADHHHHADGGVLSRRGMMLVARADRGEAFRADATALGLGEITLAEAASLWPILNPDTVVHAAYRPDAYDLDTDLLIQNYARRARGAGATFVTGAPVTAIARSGQGWRVTAGGQDHTADIIVNAAGAWADEIARMAGAAPLGITPYRRSMARIAAPGGLDTSGWPFVEGAGEESWYAKPDAGALIVSPAEEERVDPHDAWADDMVLAEGLARYEKMVIHPVTRMLANWAGLRSFAPDRTLVIGPDAHMPGFHWLAGQGGYGFQTAPAASQLAADLITGAAPSLDAATIAALSPARFS